MHAIIHSDFKTCRIHIHNGEVISSPFAVRLPIAMSSGAGPSRSVGRKWRNKSDDDEAKHGQAAERCTQSIGGVLPLPFSRRRDGLFILLGYRVSRSPLKSFCPSQEQQNEQNGGVAHSSTGSALSECSIRPSVGRPGLSAASVCVTILFLTAIPPRSHSCPTQTQSPRESGWVNNGRSLPCRTPRRIWSA